MARKTINLITLSLLLLVTFCVHGSHAEAESDDILIIANIKVPVSEVSVGELKTLFMKRRQTWRDGSKAIPIHAKDKQLRTVFQERVLGMTGQQEALFWQNQKIKHGTSEPATFANTQRATFAVKGSVSYVWRRDHKAGVNKVILVIPN